MVDWTKTNLVPLNGLEAWHQAGPTASSLLVPDASGHGRDLTVSPGDQPIFQSDSAPNGQPAWAFDNSDPLSYTGSVTAKHVFVVMAFDSDEFTDFEGVLSGITSGNVLTSNNSGDFFFVFSSLGYVYLKNSLVLVERTAPMSGNFGVIEMVLPDGFTMDGIQWGQQLADATRQLSGKIAESLIYSVEQTDIAWYRLQEYFAMRYQIWPDHPAGIHYIPFPANKTQSSEQDRETYLSDPYEGASKALVRGKFASTYDLPFLLRRQEEFKAMKLFHKQHHPLENCVFRNFRFDPPEDVIGRISSSLREQGSDVTYRFNYTFEFTETPEFEPPPPPPPPPVLTFRVDGSGNFYVDDSGNFETVLI